MSVLHFESSHPEHEPDSTDRLFGNRQELLKHLENTDARILGDLSQIITEVKPSSNQVQAAEVEYSNSPKLVEVSQEKKTFLAVFKPFSGESTEISFSYDIPAVYIREVLLGRVAEDLLQFDITPPITTRILKGELGTLQPFLSRDAYKPAAVVLEESGPEIFDALQESPDFRKIALLDAITLQLDRHVRNYLVRTDILKKTMANHPDVVAIDNPLALRLSAYNDMIELSGPLQAFTGNYFEPQNTSLTPQEIAKLHQALDRWDSFIAQNSDLITLNDERDVEMAKINGHQTVSLAQELEWARQRIVAHIREERFLSRANTLQLNTEPRSSTFLPHPAFKPLPNPMKKGPLS